jgi:hypothetical protein
MTSSCCSCHHAARTWPCWPPCPSNEAYLSSPHLEASPATTFRACSSPAPTPVKPQPAPAIPSQESVHTTLSITHHTRKRPSTGPRTTQGPQSPPWWVHWQHPHKVTREKRKRKETNKKKLQQAIERQTKAKSKITWRSQVSNPLGMGNSSTHPTQKQAQAKSANHQTKTRKATKSSPAHMQAPPETMQLPLDECMQTTWRKQSSCISSALTGQTGHNHRSDRCPTYEHGQHSDRSYRCTWPVRPVHTRAQKWLQTTCKPSKCIQQAISSSNFSPLLTMHESSKKCKTLNLELLKWTKFNIGCYTCPNEQVRYSIASYWHQLQDHHVSQPLDEAKMDLGNFAKKSPLMSKVLNMIKTYQNGKTTQTSW